MFIINFQWVNDEQRTKKVFFFNYLLFFLRNFVGEGHSILSVREGLIKKIKNLYISTSFYIEKVNALFSF